jgi:hypothetical protein
MWSELKQDYPIFSGQYVVWPIRSERALPYLAEQRAQKEAPEPQAAKRRKRRTKAGSK